MYETTLAQAQLDYPGDRLRVAANGAIEKSDHTFRIIHDATHGVNVNPLIQPRDQQKMPTAGDARAIMVQSGSRRPGVHFAIHADISKAHRRYLHRKQDWGPQACRADLDNSKVWINRVGTFGVGCASYWWSRLAAGIHRLVFAFISGKWFWQLTFADDIRFQSHGPTKYTDLLFAIFVWTLVGSPFSWKKCRGGLALHWIGYFQDYSRFEIGISESRANWIVDWGERIINEGVVLIRNLVQGLGRLGFASGVLEWYRPFLAPIYSWAAVTPGGAMLAIPPMLRLVLGWIIREFKSGRRTTPCKAPRKSLGVIFKTDAKGETDYVVLGGWECKNGTPKGQARWFSIRLSALEAPWLFTRGHGSRTIASSELLGSLLGVHLFVPLDLEHAGEAYTECTGLTDNLGNAYVVQRLLTTKMPLAAVLMQLATMLSERALWLNLTWTAREFNTEADQLTNEDFSGFDLALRIPVVWAELPFHVLSDVLAQGESFAAEIEAKKAAKKLEASAALCPGLRKRKRRPAAKEAWGD